MATTDALLTAIDAAISSITSSPSAIADYRSGDREVKRSQRLDGLIKLREQLIKFPGVDIAQMAFDFDISEFGEDLSQFEK